MTPLSVDALSYGPEIEHMLRQRVSGQIIAILESAIYLESANGHIAAIVGRDAADGPMSLRINSLHPLPDMLQMRQDRAFTVSEQTITLGGVANIECETGEMRQPAMPELSGRTADQAQAALILAHTIASAVTIKREGLGPLVQLWDAGFRAEPASEPANLQAEPSRTAKAGGARYNPQQTISDRLLARASEQVGKFVDAARREDGETAGKALSALLGLGPGLTPSGDDCVCGVLAALRWRASSGCINPLFTEDVNSRVLAAADRTNRISARLLYYASRGALYDPAMQLGAALMAGERDKIPAQAHRLFNIGNTSGIDMAVGLLIGCRPE